MRLMVYLVSSTSRCHDHFYEHYVLICLVMQKLFNTRAFWYRFMKLNRLKEDDTHYIDMIIDSKKEIGMLVDWTWYRY